MRRGGSINRPRGSTVLRDVRMRKASKLIFRGGMEAVRRKVFNNVSFL
jgi:hypothetical protein